VSSGFPLFSSFLGLWVSVLFSLRSIPSARVDFAVVVVEGRALHLFLTTGNDRPFSELSFLYVLPLRFSFVHRLTQIFFCAKIVTFSLSM